MTEQSTPLKRAAVVSRSVQIEQVALQSASLRSGIDPLAIPEELTLSQSHRARYDLPEKHPNKIFVFVDFECVATSTAPTESPPLSLSATYALVYEHPDVTRLPADALEAFARLNGVYNAWPYWRELIQTASSRAGLGMIVIPVFRASGDSAKKSNATGGERPDSEASAKEAQADL